MKIPPIAPLILGFCLPGSLPAATPPPNIVYILADDLGYGDVQCLNPRGKIPTPNMDRLAAEGMAFTDAHSSSALCTPSRYSILTGRYNWRSRMRKGVLGEFSPPLIDRDRLTVPGLLRQSGYTTACIGKWHLGITRPENAKLDDPYEDGPTTRGFDYFFGISANVDAPFGFIRNDRFAAPLDGKTTLFKNRRVPVAANFGAADVLPGLTREAVVFVRTEAAKKKPFFLYLALTSPHTPIVPNKEWQGKSGLGDYGDFVMETDWAVGKVLAALNEAGIADHTLVVFTSDNGFAPAAGTRNLESQGHFPSARFRGYKADIWEGGHRIPFFVRWPGKVKPGSKSDALVCQSDLMATCAEILRVKLPADAGEDSVSFLPAVLGKTGATARDTVVHHSLDGSLAIREGKWKLEFSPGSGGWGSPRNPVAKKQGLPDLQLYDLSDDIGETKNVQAGHPEVVARLTKLLERQIADGRSTTGPKQSNDTEVVLRQDVSVE